MKLGLTLKEECEARMRRSTTRESSRKRHLRSRHRSSSSHSSRRHQSCSSSSSYGSRSRRRTRHSSRRDRGRSRSCSGSDRSEDRKDRYGRRMNPSNITNSKDPKMVASRIFIGNLPTSDLTRDEIESRFSKYGKILGITLLQGFGFVQFEEEEEAIKAVDGEKHTAIKGNNIDIRLASDRKRRYSHGHVDDRSGDDSHHRPYGRDLDYPRPPRSYGDSYPRGLPPPPHIDPYRAGPLPPMDPYLRGPPPPPAHFNIYQRAPLPPPYRQSHPGDPYAHRPPFDPFVGGPAPPAPPGDPFRGPPYPDPYVYPGSSAYAPPVPAPLPTVDCEIIVLEEKQRAYADGIKKRLMSAGIVTEMNILPRGVDTLTALEEATRRRLLFAIIVNDQNEIHRSITVNILHGLTQEHRNMPMEDAVTLITRSYDKYMLEKQERISKEAVQSSLDGPVRQTEEFLRPTANTLYLLNLLADNRFLTVVELDTVMDYLKMRRDRLIESQGGGEIGALGGRRREAAGGRGGSVTPPPIRKGNSDEMSHLINSTNQHEEQLKSMWNLLQNEKVASCEAAAKPVESYNTSSLPLTSVLSTSINFNNPTVQQALDNLIMSGPSLLKSLSDVNKNLGNTASSTQPFKEQDVDDRYGEWERGYGAGQQYRGVPY